MGRGDCIIYLTNAVGKYLEVFRFNIETYFPVCCFMQSAITHNVCVCVRCMFTVVQHLFVIIAVLLP